MNDAIAVLITWTTYGNWMPGDARGWRKRNAGDQLPRPLLADWCRDQMKSETVLLESQDRIAVEEACRQHCKFRNWELLAVNARTNHVHLIVVACEHPWKVRDQIKANCTRALRQQRKPLSVKRTWTRGGDCQILRSESEIESAVRYVNEAQGRKYRDYL